MIERVQEFLTAQGHEPAVQVFAESSATVQLAADRLGVQPQRIAKTLAFYGDGEGEAILVVAAGDARVANASFRERFGRKARMIQADDLPGLTGYPAGGVCPFANPAGAQVFLDESLRRFASVYPAAGSPNSAVEVGLEDLFRLSGAQGWVQVCRLPEA